jgi:hypothetical protein
MQSLKGKINMDYRLIKLEKDMTLKINVWAKDNSFKYIKKVEVGDYIGSIFKDNRLFQLSKHEVPYISCAFIVEKIEQDGLLKRVWNFIRFKSSNKWLTLKVINV